MKIAREIVLKKPDQCNSCPCIKYDENGYSYCSLEYKTDDSFMFGKRIIIRDVQCVLDNGE